MTSSERLRLDRGQQVLLWAGLGPQANVDNILSNTLLPEISLMLLGAMAEGIHPTAIAVGVGDDGNFTYAPVVESAAA